MLEGGNINVLIYVGSAILGILALIKALHSYVASWNKDALLLQKERDKRQDEVDRETKNQLENFQRETKRQLEKFREELINIRTDIFPKLVFKEDLKEIKLEFFEMFKSSPKRSYRKKSS